MAEPRQSQESVKVEMDAAPRDPRYNAVRHGLTARAILLREEEAAEFTSLRDDLFRQWCPLGESECGAVYEMAEAQWRLMRCSPIEAELLESLRDPEAPAGGLAAAFLGGGEADGAALLRLMRYRRTIERSYDRALHNLLLLHRVRGVWSRPNLAEPEEGEADPRDSVNPRWCGPVAATKPMPRQDLEEEDEGPTVTVQRVIIGDNGERIPWEEYLAREQAAAEAGTGREPAAGQRESAEPVESRNRPKADILRNGPPESGEFEDLAEFSGPLRPIPRDRRRS